MGQQAANIIYECRNCHFYSAQHLNECPNCRRAKTFRAVQRVLPETQFAQTPPNIYVCQNCRYQSQQLLLECPGCGKLRTLAAVPVVGGYAANQYATQYAAQYANQYGSGTVVYGCRNLACSYRSEQWTQACPRCGKSIRTEAELKNLSLACGLFFTGIGGFILLIGVWVVVALFNGNVKTESYWAVALIFGIGSVFALGGLSGIKGHWWLLRLLIGFAR